MYIEKNKMNPQAINEIGSEFWLNSLPSHFTREIPHWLSRYGDSVLTSSGRGAISLLLDQVQPQYKSVLLPAYICDSVILPFLQQGYSCYFYDINKDLSPKISNIKTYKDIGIFVHIGYYGFGTNMNLTDVVNHFKTKSTVVIEDITHSLFSKYKRFENNDFYVASIRKWFGIPSGGILASSKKIERPLLTNEKFAQLRRKALSIKGNYIKNSEKNSKSRFLKIFSEAETFLDQDVNPYCIDDLSVNLISLLDEDELIKKRRSNYKILLDGLKDVNYLEILFPNLVEDICPLFFPILIKNNRAGIRKRLIEEKIYCPIHWPIPDQIESIKFRDSREIYDTVMSVPCDQRYNNDDMERIVAVIKNFKI